MDDRALGLVLVSFLSLVISLTVHEYGHALAAWWLGDDTASRQGRLSLNPLAHLDPIGSVAIPLLQLFSVLSGGPLLPVLGWARPVPFSATRFHRKVTMRTGSALVGMAGPGMNLLLALLCVVAYALLIVLAPGWMQGRTPEAKALQLLLQALLAINVGLACFNLIPVPPLDGGWVLRALLPYRHGHFADWVSRHAMYMLIAAMVLPSWLRQLLGRGAPDRLELGLLALAVGGVAWAIARTQRPFHWSRQVLEIAAPLGLVMLTYELAMRVADLLSDGASALVHALVRLLA